MQIFVNEKPETVEEGSTLKQWIESKGYADKKGIAVAVNETVIARDKWSNYIFKSMDRLILIGVFYGG